MLSRFSTRMLSVGLLVMGPSLTSGQDYPNKPIRIVTATAGGGSDFAARIIAPGISGPLGQPVIVENRTTIQSVDAVSKAPPDGYTITVNGSSFFVLPLLQKTSYDVVRDFSPISQLVREISILSVHPSLPAKSVKELIALAKARPGELNFASSSLGGSAHLGPELFKSMAGINIVHVPYKGTGASITALIGGEVQLTMTDAGNMGPHVKSGKVRALAVTSAQPSALFPGLPTVAAAGLPGFEYTSMTNVFAPAKTPTSIINRLHQEIARVLSQPDVKEKFASAVLETVGSSPDQLAATVRADIARTAKVIREAGIKME